MVDTLFAPTEEDIEEMCAACTQLHRALEETRMLGKKFKRRTVLLKALYKLVDAGSDQLSLKLAKLILAVSLTFLLSSRLSCICAVSNNLFMHIAKRWKNMVCLFRLLEKLR